MAPAVRGLREDARRNRECILDTARAAFAEGGTNVALEEIARRAGVGIATLYRRFPTREDLIAAAFEPKLVAYAEAARSAASEPDPWEGFACFVRAVCAMQAADAGFSDVLALTFPPTHELDRRLRAATRCLDGVIARAKAAGGLRTDFGPEDLVILLMANAGVVNAMKRHSPAVSERFVAYVLEGFRAPGHDSLPEAIDPRRLIAALRRSQKSGC